MRNCILCFVCLIAIFLAIPMLHAKGDSSIHTGDLLYLITPQTSPGYVTVIFLDERTVAVLGNTSGISVDLLPCSSTQCIYANIQLSRPGMFCEVKAWCSEIKPVSYKLDHIRCRDDRHKECLEIGIRLTIGDYFWLVPIQMTNEEFIKRWANLPTGVSITPASAEEWKGITDNLNTAKRQKEYEEENLRRTQEQERVEKLSECLRKLKAGDAAFKAYMCGAPDHTNSDLYTDQLVYFEGTMVYIDKVTDSIENVQWTQ